MPNDDLVDQFISLSKEWIELNEDPTQKLSLQKNLSEGALKAGHTSEGLAALEEATAIAKGLDGGVPDWFRKYAVWALGQVKDDLFPHFDPVDPVDPVIPTEPDGPGPNPGEASDNETTPGSGGLSESPESAPELHDPLEDLT